MAKRGRKRRMPAGLARYWAKRRGKKTSTARRRSRGVAVIMENPQHGSRKRRSRRRVHHVTRRYRRNPATSGLTGGFMMDAVYVTGGYFATRVTTGLVLPFIGTMGEQPLVRIASKGAVAWGLGWAGGNFLGKRTGQLIMLGGMIEALSDAVKTYVSPFVPALAEGETVASYPSLISSYPTMGEGYSNPYSVGVSGYDEAV